MNPTDILKDEHRVIERVLHCIEILAERATDGGTLDGQLASEALDFFSGFADRWHHAKEEELLFPLLEDKGFSADAGPTAVMRQEHAMNRNYVKAMQGVVKAASNGDPSAISVFATQAHEYASLLRQHIEKEDHCLFPMAANVLSSDENGRLLDAFREAEENKIGVDEQVRLLRLADSLCDRLGVRARAQRPSASCPH